MSKPRPFAPALTPDSTESFFLNNALLAHGHAIRMDPDASVPLLGWSSRGAFSKIADLQ